MTKRKFYKATYVVEVLSEEEPSGFESLEDLFCATRDGPDSGQTSLKIVKALDGRQAAKELLAQGSDPEFFRIDEKGNDLDEESKE